MNLSLPASGYLLACAPEGGRIGNRRRTALLVRAAAATDLVFRGRLRDAHGHAEPAGQGPTGDLVLDDLLTEVRGRGAWPWRSLLRHATMDTLRSVELQLSAAGVLTTHTTAVLRRNTRTVADAELVRTVHERAERALTSPLSEVDAASAALLALAAVAGVGVSRRTARRHSARLAEFAVPVVPALRKVVRGRWAMMAG
ncbi:GPP34 family phosphoprotein [Amycolatopsis jiangsuensis]|uniref:Golgi phosphoprotein 3 GPP34 n=1 Tax=Amycolatopsis jiangsuensis TaxID=1181879 RepID=A0A840IMM0_9PSEU|nr:GPP34 family phosphoprotein [Amycolatopsis jiangsuensis]MBB4682715.1 hypothetical protein [Amycolatopsis jiangsuensis]